MSMKSINPATGETLKEFKQRISKAEWEDPKQRPRSAKETRNWVIGEAGRTSAPAIRLAVADSAVPTDVPQSNRPLFGPEAGWNPGLIP